LSHKILEFLIELNLFFAKIGRKNELKNIIVFFLLDLQKTQCFLSEK